MKISELIKGLEEIKKEHGDIPIRKTSCHSIPEWKKPSLKVFKFTAAMDVKFIIADDEDINIGDEFIWL